MRFIFVLPALAGTLLFFPAHAHDSWLSRNSLRNAAGEWCCGEGDCFVIPDKNVSARRDGFRIEFDYIGNDGQEHHGNEVVPYPEAQPSPDGAYWRCKRPDGSRRCFFAPPPTD